MQTLNLATRRNKVCGKRSTKIENQTSSGG